MNTRADGSLIIDRSSSSQSQGEPHWRERDASGFLATFKTVLESALGEDMFAKAGADIDRISSVLSEDPGSVIR
jgi:hypothetical protein